MKKEVRFYLTKTNWVELQYKSENTNDWEFTSGYDLQLDERNNKEHLLTIGMIIELNSWINNGYEYIGLFCEE